MLKITFFQEWWIGAGHLRSCRRDRLEGRKSSKGSLHGVMHGINPRERTFLGYLPHLHKALLKRFRPKRWRVRGRLPRAPIIVAGGIPPQGFLATTESLVLVDTMVNAQGWEFIRRSSLLTTRLWLGVLPGSDLWRQKITAFAVRARLKPKGWPLFSWGFNLL